MSVDDAAVTQPILERIWTELGGISQSIRSIEKHLDEQDKKVTEVRSQTNLAGNIASNALEVATETREICRRIDQNLTGIYELAKSGFDIATAIKSASDTERPPPYESYDEGNYRVFSIRGTGN